MDAAARRTLHADLRRLRDGDRAAARPTFEALWPPCVGLARAMLPNVDDAKDAAQAAMMKLFEQAPSFDEQRSGLGWALALVSFECRTLRKKRSRRREDGSVDDHAFAAASIDVDAGLAAAEDIARVVNAFVTLSDADQQTLREFLDGERGADPAKRKRRQRALDRLRALVSPTAPSTPAKPGEPHA